MRRGSRLFKPQTVLLRWRGLRGAEVHLAIAQTLGTGVVLGEPECALTKEEGEIRPRRRLDREKVFCPPQLVNAAPGQFFPASIISPTIPRISPTNSGCDWLRATNESSSHQEAGFDRYLV